MILPWFGGGSAAATCLLFFQSLLVFGYLYSHLDHPILAAKDPGMDSSGPLAESLAALPILPDSNWKPAGKLAQTVQSMLGATHSTYDTRRNAYDLKKRRGKYLVSRRG